jgi:spore coat protein H
MTKHRGAVLVAALLAACKPPASGAGEGSDLGERGARDVGPAELGEDLAAPFVLPPLQVDLPRWELTIPQASLDAFAADPWAVEQPATFLADGQGWPVTVRLRGSSTRYLPKRSWKVDFGAAEFEGRRKLNLVAEYVDASLMAEKLGYDLLSALHVPSPRARYARLSINGAAQGVYVEIEQIDHRFLAAHGFSDPTGTVYRCGNMDCEMKGWKLPYQGAWEKKNNLLEPDDARDQLLQLISRAPEDQLEPALSQRLDLDRYLQSMAMEALIANNLVEDSQSFLVEDRAAGRFVYVPWDLNNADSRFWPTYGVGMTPPSAHPLVGFSLIDTAIARTYAKRVTYLPGYLPVFSNLNTRVAFNPALRERFLAVLERALDEVFRSEVLEPRFDAIYALLAPAMAQDPYVDPAHFQDGPRFMKRYVADRSKVLRAAIAQWRARPLGLVLEEVDPAAQAVTIRNRGASAASLSGKVVTADLRRVGASNLPAQTLAPGESATFSAAALGISLGAEGEIGLFDGVSFTGALDLLFYPAPSAGARWARDGSGAWGIR